ncbi:alkaline phosphatase family protein [Nodosilinea sp. E11]|uniref:alkaline phosphatase family protein n=1 Tax=Nodosilinea sp. E11 TaxID=3037479 RepID=UPI0029344326|nr:alkaline phosphatase family protein [Nodosilinea sp. E11]WOD42009.1 alkaline phosphatase family protein [Nodosilinea sp. E11]
MLVIGLDCMAPGLVFDQGRPDLPNLSRLMAGGSYGRLESSIPAITVPAWSCMMTFDDLAWRSVGSVGTGGLYTIENDTGPDDANHAPLGLMIFYDPKAPQGGQVLEGAQLYDLLPTLLHRYGIDPPAGLRGKVLAI